MKSRKMELPYFPFKLSNEILDELKKEYDNKLDIKEENEWRNKIDEILKSKLKNNYVANHYDFLDGDIEFDELKIIRNDLNDQTIKNPTITKKINKWATQIIEKLRLKVENFEERKSEYDFLWSDNIITDLESEDYLNFISKLNNSIKDGYLNMGVRILSKDKFKIMDHNPAWFRSETKQNGMTYKLHKKFKKKIFYYLS